MLSKDALIGSQVANYIVKKLIGKGGMGEVYLGIDIKLKRPVAIKTIDTRFLARDSFAQRFVEEAQRIATWRHENIVQVYYADSQDHIYYYVMEYISGNDLSHLIKSYENRQELMPIDEILRIGREVASALDYAHTKGTVHRDVKPANIMISNEGKAILADFGLAHDMNKSTLGGVFGTPSYIAPEQAMSPTNAVPQSDLYSLSVILYELLTGYLPFQHDTTLGLLKAHINQEPINPSTINTSLGDDVDAVIGHALSKNPEERYQTGQALMDALEISLSNIRWAQAGDPYETIIHPPNSELSESRKSATMTLGELVLQTSPNIAYSVDEDDDLTALLSTTPPPTHEPILYTEKPKREKRSRSMLVSGVIASVMVALLGLVFVLSTSANTGDGLLIADASREDTLVVNPVVLSDGSYILEIKIDGKDSIQVSNISTNQMPIALGNLQIGDENRSFMGSDWAVSELAFGECAIVLKNANRLEDMADDDCTRVGPILTYNQNRWNEDINIYFAGEFVGTCAGEEEDSVIRNCVIILE